MNGWLSAILFLFLVGIANIFWKFSAFAGFHPAVYVSHAMMAGAFALLLFSRPGSLSIETFRHPNTWLYGIFFFIGGIISVFTMGHIDAAIYLLIAQINTAITFFVGWLAFGQSGSHQAHGKNYKQSNLILQPVIILGVLLAVFSLPPELRGIALLGGFGLGLIDSLRTLTVQTHTPNNQAVKLEEQIRVTGVVMAVTGLTIFLIIFLAAWFNSLQAAEHQILFAPAMADIFNAKSILVASVYGVFCFSLMRFFEFNAIKRISGLYFLAMLSFLPVSVLIFERLSDWLGWVPLHVRDFNWLQVAAFVLVIGGSLGVIFASHQSKAVKLTGKLGRRMARDRKIAAHTVEHCRGNIKEAAKKLGVTEKILTIALNETDPAKALPAHISEKVNDMFTRNVATADALTGLLNKTHFIALFKEVLARGDQGVVLYLDLNKFKPINDTHGHEAGDEVLKIVAERLIAANKRNSVISRLGGDEFAVLLTNTTPEHGTEVISRISATLAAPIKLTSKNVQVEIGASIGQAIFPTAGTDAEALLNTADQAMYAVKKGR